jgi:hypothetical protein
MCAGALEVVPYTATPLPTRLVFYFLVARHSAATRNTASTVITLSAIL